MRPALVALILLAGCASDDAATCDRDDLYVEALEHGRTAYQADAFVTDWLNEHC